MTKKIVLGLAVVFIILQFFRIDKTVPVVEASGDFMNIHNPPNDIATILKTACYDCHSYKTKYPWYSNIAPVSWWIQEHIDHGREELNFSTWIDYSERRADHKLEEAAELVLNEEMPLPSYLRGHPEARLTAEQRTMLADWFEELRIQANADALSSEQESSDHDDDHEH